MENYRNNSAINPDDKPFVFPDAQVAVGPDNMVPLGSGAITSLLGKGGSANVYEIWNEKLEIHRAVKLIHPSSTLIEVERFETEMKISAKLHHPNIIEVHGVGKWNGLSFIEMEKIDGISLKDLIEDRGALPNAVCTAIGIMMCEALKYAHDQEYIIYGKKYNGIIHRDLKPSNIMLCENGMAKLMDFGIARPTDASFHTMDGTVVGTIHYLPPEQLNGQELDIRTDIYALGTTLYEILTSRKAFPDRNLVNLMNAKAKNQFKSLNDYKIVVPNELKKVIHKCMTHNRGKRIASADELLKILTRIHYRLTKEDPQHIIKNLVNARSYQKIVISPRKHSMRNRVIVLLTIICCVLLSIILISNKPTGLTAQLQEPPQIEDEVSPEAKPQNPVSSNNITKNQVHKAPPTVKLKAEKKSNTIKSHTQESHANIGKQSIATNPTKANIATKEEVTRLTAMEEKYGTNIPLEIIGNANLRGNYNDVLYIYDQLGEEEKKSNRALVTYLHALIVTNNDKKLKALLENPTIKINDGEFYLAKARLALEKGDLVSTEQYLDKSQKVPCLFLDRQIKKQKINYYLAKSATKKFDRQPSEESYKNALEKWHLLKREMKTNTQHIFFKEAELEMQRIAHKFKN